MAGRPVAPQGVVVVGPPVAVELVPAGRPLGVDALEEVEVLAHLDGVVADALQLRGDGLVRAGRGCRRPWRTRRGGACAGPSGARPGPARRWASRRGRRRTACPARRTGAARSAAGARPGRRARGCRRGRWPRCPVAGSAGPGLAGPAGRPERRKEVRCGSSGDAGGGRRRGVEAAAGPATATEPRSAAAPRSDAARCQRGRVHRPGTTRGA